MLPQAVRQDPRCPGQAHRELEGRGIGVHKGSALARHNIPAVVDTKGIAGTVAILENDVIWLVDANCYLV